MSALFDDWRRYRNPNSVSRVKKRNPPPDVDSDHNQRTPDDDISMFFWPQFDVDRQRYLHTGIYAISVLDTGNLLSFIANEIILA